MSFIRCACPLPTLSVCAAQDVATAVSEDADYQIVGGPLDLDLREGLRWCVSATFPVTLALTATAVQAPPNADARVRILDDVGNVVATQALSHQLGDPGESVCLTPALTVSLPPRLYRVYAEVRCITEGINVNGRVNAHATVTQLRS